MEYEEAKMRVKALKGFYIHLAVYLFVMAGLIFIDYLQGDGWWFYYPMIGWGIAVLIHGVSVFVDVGIFGHEWEEHKIKELMSHSPKHLKA